MTSGGGGTPFLPNGNAINLGTGAGVGDGYIAEVKSDGTGYLLISYIGGSTVIWQRQSR